MRIFSATAMLVLSITLAGIDYAYAYIDPGILGVLYQSAYVFFAGLIAMWVIRPWHYIRHLMKRDKDATPSEEEASQKDG